MPLSLLEYQPKNRSLTGILFLPSLKKPALTPYPKALPFKANISLMNLHLKIIGQSLKRLLRKSRDQKRRLSLLLKPLTAYNAVSKNLSFSKNFTNKVS